MNELVKSALNRQPLVKGCSKSPLSSRLVPCSGVGPRERPPVPVTPPVAPPAPPVPAEPPVPVLTVAQVPLVQDWPLAQA